MHNSSMNVFKLFFVMFCLNIFPSRAEEKFIDYSYFYGRVSDLSKDQKIVRFSTENRNIKLFRAGDTLRFRVIKDKNGEECIGHVRDSDENYLVFLLLHMPHV